MKGKENVLADYLSRIAAIQLKPKFLRKSITKLKEGRYSKEEKEKFTEIHDLELPLLIDITRKIVVAKNCLFKILVTFHKKLAHCGAKKLYYTLKDLYFGKNMSRKCQEVVKTCQICQVEKSTKVLYGLKHNYLQSKTLFEVLATDLVGPYETWELTGNFEKDKIWFLTIVDTCSRFTKVFSLYSTTSSNIIDYFLIRFKEVELPRICISDQGRQFVSS